MPAMTEALRFTAVYERDESGWIVVHVLELPEVHTQGRTLEEAREMVRDATALRVQTRREQGDAIPVTGWVLVGPVDISAA